jgi:hypothetical protein
VPQYVGMATIRRDRVGAAVRPKTGHDYGVPAGPSNDSWKPNGWDEWSAKRRRLWRREQQAERMERLQLTSDEQRESRDRLVERLRAEAAELRREIASEDDGEASL